MKLISLSKLSGKAQSSPSLVNGRVEHAEGCVLSFLIKPDNGCNLTEELQKKGHFIPPDVTKEAWYRTYSVEEMRVSKKKRDQPLV